METLNQTNQNQVIQTVNRKYEQLFKARPRYFILMGGRAAGRSTVASQFVLAKLRDPEYFRAAIMRFVLGDIRNSIFQDIYDRIDEQSLIGEVNVKEHLLAFEYGSNKVTGIGFRKSSSDQKSKLKSLANYNCVVIEEADEVSEEDFTQLDDSIRKAGSDIIIILLLNPPDKNHWIIKRWFNLLPGPPEAEGFYMPQLKDSAKEDTIFIHSTFRDNIKNLNQSSIRNYQMYRYSKPDHYWNMIEGLVSEGQRGRIYKTWQPTTDKVFDELPFASTYALDFGFSNDPTALVEIKDHNKKVWARELIYQTGMTNQDISDRMEQLGLKREEAIIYADSAEPKSIEELRRLGWNVIPSDKGADSVKAGIDLMLTKEVFYTENSENIKLENQEYKWALDKNKEPLNIPIDDFNHAMDAIRYNIFTRSRQPFVGFA